MTLTLLLDLDDTLLNNQIDQFVPAYTRELARALSGLVAPEKMGPAFMLAARTMLENTRADRNLEQVFIQAFCAQLDLDVSKLEQALQTFYAGGYRSLHNLTTPRPEAIALVEEALRRGYRVVVATNPLFPATAVYQRLEWACLSVNQYPFALVTSADHFHFSKSSPAYYAEILAHLGWPEGPVVMVGDDPEMDILSARRLGLPTFQVVTANNRILSNLDGGLPASYGTLDQVITWLDSLPEDTLQPDPSSAEAVLAILAATPAALSELCGSLSAQRWQERPAAGEWCPAEIVCHLRDVDREVNLHRIKLVLDENNPFVAGQDTDPWAETRSYIRQDARQALVDFTTVRAELVAILNQLSPQDWERTARHAIFGRTTLLEMIQIVASHDRLHLRQITRCLQTSR